MEGGAGGGGGATSVSQKWPDQIFPTANFVFPRVVPLVWPPLWVLIGF